MKNLLGVVEDLKSGKPGGLVAARMREFRAFRKKSDDEIFSELCFCILTANFDAERAIEIQKKIKRGFITLPEKTLANRLAHLGYRFPNTRAHYIALARKHREGLKKRLASLPDDSARREWLVKNVKGLGYKEASHFLRNIGYCNIAIIDFHIMDILARHGLTERPKALSKRTYLGIENLLREIALKSGLSLAELDLYLWFAETGKVLK